MILGGRPTNPGELNTQIVLKKRSVAIDAGGFQAVTAGDTIATVWSRWRNVHGSEVWSAAAQNAIKPATVLIRYNSSLNETCLVQKGSDLYEIISIDNIDERSEYMELKVQLAETG